MKCAHSSFSYLMQSLLPKDTLLRTYFNFFKFLQEHYQSVKWSYPDENRHSVGTELGPNYLQILSAEKERVGNLGNNEYKSG